MKFLTKLIISASILTPITAGVIYAETKPIIEKKEASDNSKLLYTVTKGDKTLTVNRKNLDFEVQIGDKVWKSNPIEEDHEKITSYRRGFLGSALTLYYLTSDAGEGNFSIFTKGRENMTRVVFEKLEDGFKATLKVFDGRNRKDPDLSVDITLEVRLIEEGVSIRVIDIKENESKNKLSKIIIYPGFAGSYKLVDGFILVPDGNGALIDLSKKTNARSVLNLNVYDSDIGVMDNNRKPTTSEILTMPLFGITEKDKSTLAYIDEGEEYATLSSKVSGITDSYNISYFTFNLRNTYYRYQGIGENTKRPTPQEAINEVRPVINYILDNKKYEYYDFAKVYQETLIKKDLLNKAKSLKNDMRLEFLMAENKKSMFGREVIKMTSTKFIKEKANELKNKNLDLQVALLGYSNNGLTNSYPNCFPIETKTGKESDYKELGNTLKELGYDYSFITDNVRSFKDSGISKSNLAMNMSEKYIEANDYNLGNTTRYNHLILKTTKDKFNANKSYLDKYKATGFDDLSLGNKLYSSHYNQKFSRTDAIKTYSSLIENEDKQVSLRKPNQYMFKNFSNYLDTPLKNSGFVIESESVPFLSMVLSGFKNMYSSPINLNYTGKDQILNLIDFNIKPTLLLSEESAINLLDTTSDHIFSSKYSDWEEDLISIYEEVNSILETVKDANFVSRTKLEEDVYLNSYSNNKKILVNYSDSDFKYNDLTISSKSAEVF